MELGKSKIFFISLLLIFIKSFFAMAEDKIQSVPLINLEDLSPTFEEDKDELEKIEEKSISLSEDESKTESSQSTNNEKIYINLTALDKITAKTSSIRLAVGDKKFFGPLEIKALKCQLFEGEDISDTVAYIQVKDLSTKDNDRVLRTLLDTFESH